MSDEARRKWRHVSDLSRRLSSRVALEELLSLTTDSTLDPDYESPAYSGDPWQGHYESGQSGTVGQYASRMLQRADHRAVPALLSLARRNPLAATHLARIVQSAVSKVGPDDLRAAGALVGRDVNEGPLWLAFADLRDGERSADVFSRMLRAMEDLPEPRAAELVSHVAVQTGCAPLLAMFAASHNLSAVVRARVFVAVELDRRPLSHDVVDALTAAVHEDDDPELLRNALGWFRSRNIQWPYDPKVRARHLIDADPSTLGAGHEAAAMRSLAHKVAQARDQGARDDLVEALCMDSDPLRRRLLIEAIHQDPPLPDAHVELLVAAYRRRLAESAQREDVEAEFLRLPQVAAALLPELSS